MQIVPKKASTSYAFRWRDAIVVTCFVAAMFHPVTRVIAIGSGIAWAAVSVYRKLKNAPDKQTALRDVLKSDDDDNVIH
jgi:hypothetical protein